MATTRSINMPTEYCLEQRENQLVEQNTLQRYRKYANPTNNIPCFGVNVGHMPREVLSNNPIEIENGLFGINTPANLVSYKRPFTPRLKKLPCISFFERPQLIMPDPFITEINQRPHIP